VGASLPVQRLTGCWTAATGIGWMNMLLANRFTYIHEPKTGGTFVTYVLTQLHGRLTDLRPSRFPHSAFRRRFPTASLYFDRLGAPAPRTKGGPAKYGSLYSWNDHGTCSEIPRMYRSRQILATVRNPFETYASEYLFGWWKRPEWLSHYNRTIRDFPRRYPSFPDLSFREYLELLHAAWTLPANRDFYEGSGSGYLTKRFIRFYFRTPWILRGTKYDVSPVIRRLDPEYVESGSYVADMFRVHFLPTSRLNQELQRFLLEMDYDPADVEFVKNLEHVLPVGGSRIGFAGRATSHDWRSFYTKDLKEIVRKRDQLIFALFPEFDVP
jgi:hypothetical protein